MTLLSQGSALNPGQDLWIVPELAISRWTRTIDWYLNMQLVKWVFYKPKELPPTTAAILEHTGLPDLTFKCQAGAPLLIPSAHLLPNRWTVKLPSSDLWVEDIKRIWLDLDCPGFRVFLPQLISPQDFQNAWTKVSSFEDYSLVAD